VVAPKFQELIVNAYAGEKEIIKLPGSGHNSPLSDVALQAMKSFVARTAPHRPRVE
jgi:hypothetical protein